jgi:aryl-alcohol dehydrogenase-like predicted oxidoreductase
LSTIGLGLAALGRPGYLTLGHGDDLGEDRSVEHLEGHCHEVLDAAHEAGVRHFDAARSYGRAEEFLGSWLESRGIEPGAVTVSSKWGYTYTAGWRVDADPPEVKDLSVDTLRRQLGETRSWIGRWLSLYQIHSATVSSGVLDDAGVLEELARLRESGVAVGLTVTGTEQAETIERALERGGFDSVQATYNLLERSAGPALERARAAGLRVMVKEAVANGRLTPRGECEQLEAVAKRLGVTSDAVALAAVLSRPWVDVVLSGASTTEQLLSNLAALSVRWSAELEEELAALAEPSEPYWSTRSALSWT